MNDQALTIAASAKINLFLKILGKRSDGYHDIYSLVQAISLHDELTLSIIGSGIELTASSTDVPLDSGNIVWKAIDLLRERVGFREGIRVHLTKRIPVGAGLGGGSSDAAATLKGVNKLLKLGLSSHELQRLGAVLGSDVPFFFSSGSALISGRGEIVENVVIPSEFRIVLIVPDFAVSTAEAYAGIRIYLTNFSTKPTLNWEISSAELFELLDSLGNDFQPQVTDSHPEVAHCMRFLQEAGAKTVALSGSGSAFFGLFDRAPDPSLTTEISGLFGWQVFCLCPVKLA